MPLGNYFSTYEWNPKINVNSVTQHGEFPAMLHLVPKKKQSNYYQELT